MKKILVSKCLYGGEPVRYDGKSKAEEDSRFLKWKEEGRFIPICPEVFGGLPTPRTDAQRQGDKVVTRDGRDVTAEYTAGAKEAVRLAKENDVLCAVMKAKSPSCGSGIIYDGTFSGTLTEGDGLAVELLRKSGVKVYSEKQLDEVEKLIPSSNCRTDDTYKKRCDKETDNRYYDADDGRCGVSEHKSNIILIGMPACGKSVTGVVLAKSLKMNFLDTDLLIQEKAGKGLQDIINEDGVDVFKRMEEEILTSVDIKNTVIATGGSAVYYPKAMEHLKNIGHIVYIEVPIGTVKKRLRNITTRGVAMQKGQTIEDLYNLRVPLYEKYGEVTVQSEDYIEKTVERIIEALEN